MTQMLEKLNPIALLLVRVIAGYLFLLHGTAKFFEFPLSMTEGNGSVPLFSLFGLAAIIEISGGILLILGLATRLSALVLSGQMAYAYFFIHATAETFLFPMLNQGELAVLYSVLFLMFVFTGAGKFSLDYKIMNKH
ncbi:hypothetical protein A6B43_06210 [Vespertiliibacter pulmonis]|uniref:Putative oxidoreductase n=1 Tax=Vespertiliibacter pulmonis TaxID=1443036 RepID=A0A3N4WET5_9PAST|nr:DoxX family protein [Vespertiliibacter pulmonis]QLB21142.1 hypothetical protein A6B43_06210 [Vespertiliibacter pulmonis]RPE83754.1 putative oxidoreductase [Vespertiliibacter pulmonis]